ADDLGLSPQELYLTPEELRNEIDALQRVELRALGRTTAQIDQELVLDAEAPKISVGKERKQRKPLFLFAHAHKSPSAPEEVEWTAQSVMRYHGRLPELATDVIDRHREKGVTTLFVMPSAGVAERIAEIL